MIETVRKWGERPRESKWEWKNDILAAKELLYPKDVIRKLEDEPDSHKRQQILRDARLGR